MSKYGNAAVWRCFTTVYELLPLAAIVDKERFCCHGGLSPDFLHIEDIEQLKRGADIPHDGGLCDLVWSDPNPDNTSKSKRKSHQRIGRFLLEAQATTSDSRSLTGSSIRTS
jgi:diadenosine tetraphosphatase ApaH/serine/threonine PP2A family protein phosphatase